MALGPRDIDFGLYVLAALCELAGVVLTISDIRSTSSRLRKFKETEPPIQITASGHASSGGRAELSGGQLTTPEERLSRLEEWRSQLDDELDRRQDQLAARLESEMVLAVNATYKTFMDRWRLVKEFLTGEDPSGWRAYRGPVLILAGIVIGLVGNLVSLLY